MTFMYVSPHRHLQFNVSNVNALTSPTVKSIPKCRIYPKKRKNHKVALHSLKKLDPTIGTIKIGLFTGISNLRTNNLSQICDTYQTEKSMSVVR